MKGYSRERPSRCNRQYGGRSGYGRRDCGISSDEMVGATKRVPRARGSSSNRRKPTFRSAQAHVKKKRVGYDDQSVGGDTLHRATGGNDSSKTIDSSSPRRLPPPLTPVDAEDEEQK
ncbi:hypothetical protein V493_08193 [Pseudogymnoascus sp. VKM F-4281 (FW-2241)]|nr:hypothetical protein V493_08193 [Pseudogymnoascus sp. VKM F-4281 (FW-2241)]